MVGTDRSLTRLFFNDISHAAKNPKNINRLQMACNLFLNILIISGS